MLACPLLALSAVDSLVDMTGACEPPPVSSHRVPYATSCDGLCNLFPVYQNQHNLLLCSSFLATVARLVDPMTWVSLCAWLSLDPGPPQFLSQTRF